jgi:tol-pal system protein YbgF
MPNRQNERPASPIARRGARASRAAFITIGRGGAIALLAAACSWYPAERGQRLEGRVDRIEEERPAAAQGGEVSSAALREQLARVDASLGDIRKRLDGLEAAPPAKAGSPEGQQLSAELTRLRATLEQHTQRLDAMERTIAQGRGASGQAATQGKRAPAKAPPRAPSPAPEATASVAGTGTAGGGAGALALAREQEKKGEKGVARELYQQYVAQFPTDPAAAEAHYRLGDLAFGERKYDDAIVEFGKVAKDFPRSDRAPDALLRTADSMIALGMKDDAAVVLSEIPRRYPGTPAAARATKRLGQQPKPAAPPGKTNE